MKKNIRSIEEWEDIVKVIVPLLKHNILLLKGNLGAGKTSFTQALLRHLGSRNDVSSPTYALVNDYDCPQGKVFHFDLYRIKSLEEVYDIGMEEYLDQAFLCIIEWPEIYEVELEDLPHHEMIIENHGDYRQINFV